MASLTTTPSVVYTLSLTEDELHAIYALTGAVASTKDSMTGDIYDTIRDALETSTSEPSVQARYVVGDLHGGYVGALYLTEA